MAEQSKRESFQTASELAYSVIRQKILSGEFKPGDSLSRRKMAEVTGVSVIPVSEALKKLEEDRLVESKPKWGSFVTVPTLALTIEVHQYRSGLECEAVRILAERLSDEQRRDLIEMAEELDNKELSEQTFGDIRQLHFKFHARLVELTGNMLMFESMNRVALLWWLCRRMMVTDRCAPVGHRELVQLIASGDSDAAERAMRSHICAPLEEIKKQYQAEG